MPAAKKPAAKKKSPDAKFDLFANSGVTAANMAKSMSKSEHSGAKRMYDCINKKNYRKCI